MATIKEALDFIHSTNKFGVVLGLDNIKRLLELMGNPQEKLKFIHVAGTNGKGSTSSYITKVLEKAGYRIGLFTSPYLEAFNERIRINDEYISDEHLSEITFYVKEKIDQMVEEGHSHPTEFEIVTAIAIEYYLRQSVDLVLLEVGMGGRYDATNVISKPEISVITPIGMDHIGILGDTLAKIANEKAGIIKKDSTVVVYPQEKEAEEVVESVAKEQNAEIINVPLESLDIKKIDDSGSKFDFKYGKYELKDLEIRLIGKHQAANASTAITALLALKDKGIVNLEELDIREGLKETRWIGRLELLSENPRFLIDGAHNMQGITALKKALSELFNYDKLILGIGILADKDVDDMVAEMAPVGDVIIVTEPNIHRAMKADELGKKFKDKKENVIVEKDIKKAIDKSFELAGENDLIVFSGSLYLIGDVRKYANIKINE
jgi:dihydrofolate synthase / folylpolyglutamate synthase